MIEPSDEFLWNFIIAVSGNHGFTIQRKNSVHTVVLNLKKSWGRKTRPLVEKKKKKNSVSFQVYRACGNGSIDFKREKNTGCPIALNLQSYWTGRKGELFPSSQMNRTYFEIFYNYALSFGTNNKFR